MQAGQVLKTERDQLAQLMGHLRQDYEAVERAKVAQQEELAALKDRMKKKGAANNKKLVKVGIFCSQTRRVLFHYKLAVGSFQFCKLNSLNRLHACREDHPSTRS